MTRIHKLLIHTGLSFATAAALFGCESTEEARATRVGAALRRQAASPRGAKTLTDVEAPTSGTVIDDGEFDVATADRIHELFARLVTQRNPPGTAGVKRAVFLKPHGCAKSTFTVSAGLPERFQKGLFASASTHEAWIRISSDTIPSTSDGNNNTIGFAVKVLGVAGPKVLAGEENAETHDFLLQNHPVFFVDTAADFLDITEHIFQGTTADYFHNHPTTELILKAMAKPVSNVLWSSYWSTTPSRFGETDFAKYKLRPCAQGPDEPLPSGSDQPNYLRTRMERDLRSNVACFELQVQLRADASMPLDRATVRWSEEASSPVTVATIRTAPQDISVNDATCENLAFTVWHALPAHRPVGSINKARGLVYKAMADNRRTRNGVPLGEPSR